MTITEQRKAIYDAERIIESALDELRTNSGLNADSITVQTILDDDMNEAPAVKINIVVSRLKK